MHWLVIASSPIILLFSWIFLRFLLCVWNYKQVRYKLNGTPAMPGTIPLIYGFVEEDTSNKLLERLVKMSPKGTILDVVVGGAYLGRPVVLVNSPELLKEVSDDTVFPKLPALYAPLRSFLGTRWRKQRTHINPFFFPRKLQAFISVMASNSKEIVDQITTLGTGELDCLELIGEFAQKTMIDIFFSGKIDHKWATERWQKANVSKNRTLFISKIVSLCEEARKNPSTKDEDSTDFIESMINVKDENGNQAMSDYAIAEESLTLLFAGHDTLKNTEMEKLQQEVDEVLKGQVPTEESILNLKRCKNALQETLRLRPPVPQTDRIAVEDCYIGSHFIPKGTTILMNIHALGMDESFWEEPYKYNPDRFNKETSFTKNFMPFLIGPRNCVGQKFAMNEGVILLAIIMQNFDVYLGKGKISPVFEGTLVPKGLKCKFIPRRK